jgi:hypothetical protein
MHIRSQRKHLTRGAAPNVTAPLASDRKELCRVERDGNIGEQASMERPERPGATYVKNIGPHATRTLTVVSRPQTSLKSRSAAMSP